MTTEPKVITDEKDGERRRILIETCTRVCSRAIGIELKEDIIEYVEYIGGCSGNTQGLSMLLKGMNVSDAISKLRGIDCGGRGTSCPDQLAKGLELALQD